MPRSASVSAKRLNFQCLKLLLTIRPSHAFLRLVSSRGCGFLTWQRAEGISIINGVLPFVLGWRIAQLQQLTTYGEDDWYVSIHQRSLLYSQAGLFRLRAFGQFAFGARARLPLK